MESNNLISAPQIDGVDRAFKVWERSRFGTMGDYDGFYRFMTTPSCERSVFIDFLRKDFTFDDLAFIITIRI